jgi:hypothetical protein
MAFACVLLLVGLVGLSSTAFAQAATATPTATAMATATPTVAATASPTSTPVPAATATPTPTVAQAATPTGTPVPSLSLNPQQGPAGTAVQATGSNFLPGDVVQLLFNGVQVDSENANTTGTVNFNFTVPSLAQAQYPVVATGRTQGSATVTFNLSGNVLTLSSQQGTPGSSLTATGRGFQPGETVILTFNGTQVGSPTADTTGSFTQTFTVPTLAAGQYQVQAKGQSSGNSASATFTIGGTSVTLSATSGAVGSSLTANGSGFTPGDSIQLVFNGALVDSGNADINGNVTFTFNIPVVAPGAYQVVMTGRAGGLASATFTVTGPGPTATPTPATAPTPTPTPATAPAIPHDNRYFAATGYRIDNDSVYSFFQSYGDVQTFGFPTSRTFNFLGCPVQFFQRQIIQVCAGAGAALINILDPGIFPYTAVNGSTFPPPDPTMKANTPPVSSPTYSQDIITFINANVPNSFNGQPVNFLNYFNTQGSLTIWGAPISPPAPDPTNSNFIYQRFQRGIMHYIAGTGTESILVADYLKALILDQNVPLDLRAEATAQNSPYLKSYCPGQPLWMCQPNQVPGTDYTFAFVPG